MSMLTSRPVTAVFTTLILLAAWWGYVTLFHVPPFILPPPQAVFAELVRLFAGGSIWPHLGHTLGIILVGFVLGSLGGFGLGFILAKFPRVERIVAPYLLFFQTAPKIALAPLFILWFGFGLESKIVIAAALAFFPVFSNALVAFRSVEPGDRDVFTMLQASPVQRFIMLDLPTAFPVVLAGMEVAVVMSMIGAIVGEFIGGNEGLGYLAVSMLQELQVPGLFAVIVFLTLIGLTLYTLIAQLRGWLTPWHASVARAGETA